MLKIDRQSRTLEPTLSQTLIQAGLKERQDLQDLIERNYRVFFDEIGLSNALLLGTEVKPAGEFVGDRIDVLAIDEDGTIIVIELKRGSNKLQLLQAITYASMIAKWQPDQFSNLSPEVKINGEQRIVLIADEFEYEVLTAAEWLVEKYNVDILCIRLQIARDPGSEAEYLTSEQVYPPLEVEDQFRVRKRGASAPARSPAEILKASANIDVSVFFEQQIKSSLDASPCPGGTGS
jgi:hypothetical protein